METKSTYNFDLFNDYFSPGEFDFINNTHSEDEKLNNLIESESNKREIIVKFINNLNDYINSFDNNISDENVLNLLSEVQDVFEKTNENIEIKISFKFSF